MTWRTIPDTEIDADSPLTAQLMSALRDNPIAIANADSGATAVVFNAIRAGVAAESQNAVGTLAFAAYDNGGASAAFGVTTSASNLTPACYFEGDVSGNGINSAGSMSGTWRCLGYGYGGSGDTTRTAVTLWLRTV